jgi:CRISPR/Cas system-associated protein endoribonuclease Cas2
MFSGMRIYLRYIPFFLLPTVWTIDEKELKRFLKFILVLAFLQFPVVVYQRFFKYSSSLSGDPMGGTLGENTSGVLSVLLLLVLSFYIILYLKEHINFIQFIIGASILIMPTTMNETKITFVLLPVAFILPLFFGGVDKKKLGKVITIFIYASLAFIILRVIYDHFIIKRWGYGITDFLIDQKRLKAYIDFRLEPILKTIKIAVEDSFFFIFGVGAGNASTSFTTMMSGAYVDEFARIGKIPLGITVLIWELGFFGVMTLSLFLFFLFIDAFRLSKLGRNFTQTLGLSMTIIIPIYSVTVLYFDLVQVLVLNCLFWLLCGFIAKEANSLYYKRI